MKRKDGDVTRSDEGRETYRNASEASAGTMESLRGALLGIVPGIKEAAAWDEDDELSIKTAEWLGAVQFVYWQDVPDDLVNAVLDSRSADDIDDAIREVCLPDDWESFSATADSLDELWFPDEYWGMLNQCVDALCQHLYGIACAGLCTIFDGLLSDFRETFGEGLGERLGSIVGCIADEADGQGFDEDQTETLMFLTSFAGAVGSFGEDVNLTPDEPKTLNRLWFTHGRTWRERTMTDCLKLLRMIQGLLILKGMREDDEGNDGEEDDG